MKTLAALLASLAIAGALAHAAEWLSFRGDPQGSGWQRHEKALNPKSVKGMKLLWKRQLDNQSRELNSITAPTLLGPIITHRGIKELVFVAGASDVVYAVDADLGKVFWKRKLDSPPPSCGPGLTATPVIAPVSRPLTATEEEEGSSPLRPIYVLASDGRLHTIRASDGEETAPAVKFIPPNAGASALNLAGKSISTATSAGCGVADGVWSMEMGAGPALFSTAKEPATAAGWDDASGTRWIYAVEGSGIAASKRLGQTLTPVWKSRTMTAPMAPVIVNGIVFVLDGGSKSVHATLYALDGATGKELFSSGAAITSFAHSGGLGVANGHVCFGTWDNTLYCFGLPLEI